MNSLKAERTTILATPAAKLLLGGSVVMAVASCCANLAAVDDLNTDDAVQLAMHSSTVTTMIFAMLGGLYSATTDHRFGIIEQRLLSQPNRIAVLGAKAMAASIVGLLYGVLGAITGAATAWVFYKANGEVFDLGSPIVRNALIGVIIAATLFAAIGVAVGMIVRNQPIAIGGGLAWLLIAEPAAILGVPNFGKWLPGASGLALTFVPDPNMLSQPTGALVLGGYTTVALLIAAYVFRTGDA